MDEMTNFRNWSVKQIDSLVRENNFNLLQDESDSTLSTFYYNSREKAKDDLIWIRSFTLAKTSHKGLVGRLLTYRTYNGDEYLEILKWLAENGYKKSKKFDFKDSKHTLYQNGREVIRIIVKKQILPNGRETPSYEIELGA